MIIGLCGPAGSGKDTAADFLVKNHGFVKVAFADPLKRVCKDVFDFTDEQLWGPSSARNAADNRYPRPHSTAVHHAELCNCCGANLWKDASSQCYLTPRYALQQLGTEWGRICYPNIWVEYALRTAKKLENRRREDDFNYYSQKSGLMFVGGLPDPKGVAVPDVRFKNEVDAIHAAGGFVIRLMRNTSLGGAAAQHRSETELAEMPEELFDVIIDNHGTLATLERFTASALAACKTK